MARQDKQDVSHKRGNMRIDGLQATHSTVPLACRPRLPIRGELTRSSRSASLHCRAKAPAERSHDETTQFRGTDQWVDEEEKTNICHDVCINDVGHITS